MENETFAPSPALRLSADGRDFDSVAAIPVGASLNTRCTDTLERVRFLADSRGRVFRLVSIVRKPFTDSDVLHITARRVGPRNPAIQIVNLPVFVVREDCER